MSRADLGELPVRRLAGGEESAAGAVLARSFRHDPLVRYYFGNEEPGRKRLARVFGYAVRYAVLEGEVLAIGQPICGIAAWLPPGHTELQSWSALRAGGAGLAVLLGPQVTSRTERYGQFAKAIHRRHMKDPHWYLYVLGVDPGHQGHGLAGALLRWMIRRLDRDGRRCYLETHNPDNLRLYEHFGFHVVADTCIPGTNVPHWAMVRNPRTDG